MHNNRGTQHASQTCTKQTRPAFFCVARLPHSECFPEQQPQIVGRTLNGVGLAHIFDSSQPTAPPPASLTHMRKGSLASLAAPPIQSTPFVPAHSPAIGSK